MGEASAHCGYSLLGMGFWGMDDSIGGFLDWEPDC